jgi:Ca2+-transporting ATPase
VSNAFEDSSREAYHAMAPAEVVRRLGADPVRGLSDEEVTRRRARYGENRIAGDAGTRPLAMLARQFTDLMIVVLLVAAAIAGLIGEAMNAIAIMVIVVLNAIIGFVQEYRAERALAALQELSAPQVQVVRAGRSERIPEAEVVPGTSSCSRPAISCRPTCVSSRPPISASMRPP